MLRPGLSWFLCLITLLALQLPAVNAEGGDNLEKGTFASLDQVTKDKHRQLTAYLDRMCALAATVREDPVMRRYFSIKQRYWQLQQEQPAPPEALSAIESLKETLLNHYLNNYLAFYDILFVDSSGYVLSAIRHQADYHKHLFEGERAKTALARHLMEEPSASFVDYEFYNVSDEPSAFFVEPVIEDGQQLGWFVLQCAINRINTIFTRGEELGQTGEIFLVNRKHQMLTESRLDLGAGTLNRYLSEENIEGKFAEKQGHKRVIDYRDRVALTSFAVCPVMGSEWLLVSKIDEDEVITRHYLENLSRLQPSLTQSLGKIPQPDCPPCKLPTKANIVDMDEFRRSNDTPLITFGVSTCTAIVVSLKQEKAYLAHASVQDRIYGAGDLDLLDYMLRRIRRFEIYPYQLRSLEVVLVAPHLESVTGAVEKLVEAGILLSQIRFLHCPEAESATVFHTTTSGQTVVQWIMGGEQKPRWQRAADTPSLGESVKEIIGFNKTKT
ncbi:MAG: hypothetical protein KOO60_01690 [Gemmatimonadales bacterium]|nr:hypothetical protein [Gemmatimonadales bacterium]